MFLASSERRSIAIFVAVLFWAIGCGVPFGIYHKIEPGQTLYRIARTYNTSVQKIVEVNRLKHPDALRAGQQVFIPGATRTRYVATSAAATRPEPTRKPSSVSSKPRVKSAQKPVAKSNKAAPPILREAGPAPNFGWPTRGKISSSFGKLDDRNHDGIDISADRGTEILAAADGTVIYAGNGLRGYGNLIILKHPNGYSTIYAHNQDNLVKKGSFVAKGEKIGTVGSTGRSSGPHLHFEIRAGKKPVNPLKYLPKST